MGESCRARNDCRTGLACISQVCAPGSVDLSATGKSCYRVECGANADCCVDFVPASGCDVYESECLMDPTNCYAFHALCQCNRICTDNLCVNVGPSCAVDGECPSVTVPYCVGGRCVACREHGDCGEGARCIEGKCDPQCKSDANCPLLYTCNAGTCVLAGCTSDRECVFVLGQSRGRCVNKACVVGCSDDAECNVTAFEVCRQGLCTFVGCNTDAECRAYLGLSETPGNVRAQCL